MSGATTGMSNNYNSNSSMQKFVVQSSIKFIEEAIDVLDVDSVDIIADFGCSQGLNSIYAMKAIINYLKKTNKYVKEPFIFHNDLPTNDWRTLFQLLIEDNSYKGVASGRSFYEQCLPNNSLQIGYSSTSIHWLSKKPCNLSNHCYIGLSQDFKEREAFKYQAYLDYCQFLQHRSRELVPGGVLILTILGTNEQGKTESDGLKQILYECAQLLPLTSQELIDFSLPLYCRSYEECIDERVFTQYSFDLIKSKFASMSSPLFKQWKEGHISLDEFARSISLYVQGWSESILQQTLINNGRTKENISIILNQFWALYEEKVKAKPDVADFCLHHIYLILKKK
jgi:hypothetical protein